MNHFKSQQEIWKYLADGGAIISQHQTIVKFEGGVMLHLFRFDFPSNWSPYIEPVAKTKVWRWEKVEADSCGNKSIFQYTSLFTEATAADLLPGYTKVPGSEREI